MSRTNRLSVLFWFLSLSVLYGQTDSLLLHVHGQLTNAENGESIPYAHILLNSKLVGITSDNDGLFTIDSQINDSLFISSIGFDNLRLAVKDLNTDSSLNIIKLNSKVYMLGEIKITQYPSYERLVEIVVNPILSNEEKSIFRVYSNLEKAGLAFVPRENDGIIRGGAGGPITGIYNLFSRSVKRQKQFNQIKRDEKSAHKFTKKISPDMIKKITGITDSTLIVEFIKYCNFSESYINSSSEYELIKQIHINYENFSSEKE